MGLVTDTRVIRRTVEGLKQQLPYILHQGGTSSGKTYGILYSLLFYALKFLEPGTLISVVSHSLPHLKRGAINDFRDILSKTELDVHVTENKTDHTYVLPNQVRFEFFATDNEHKAKSGKRNLLFINEADFVNWSIANQLLIRTTGPKILDWNPSGKYWLHRMLLPAMEESEYLFTRTTYRDNPSVAQKIIQEIERLRLIDPDKYQIYGMGEEGKGTEIIFPTYTLVDKFPDTLKVGVGLDFGFTNHESASLRVAYYDGCLWFDELIYQKGMSNRKIFDTLQAIPYTLADVIADSAEPKSIAELKSYGLNIRGAVKGPDSIKFGIDQIKRYPMMVTKSSANLIDEIDSYKWLMVDGRPVNTPRPGQKDHLMDAMRYGIQAVLSPVQPIKAVARASGDFGFSI